MQISFTIPDNYIGRISDAFEVETVNDFKNKIIEFVRHTVKEFEVNEALELAKESIIIESDLIE